MFLLTQLCKSSNENWTQNQEHFVQVVSIHKRYISLFKEYPTQFLSSKLMDVEFVHNVEDE